jgi:hypothetical protein
LQSDHVVRLTGDLSPRARWRASHCSVGRALDVVSSKSAMLILRVLRGGKLDGIRAAVRETVEWPAKCGVEQRLVTHASGAAVLDELPIMDREYQVILDPGRLAHLANAWSVFL